MCIVSFISLFTCVLVVFVDVRVFRQWVWIKLAQVRSPLASLMTHSLS